MATTLAVSSREASLTRAGFNVLNLLPSDVETDLLSDVPHSFREAFATTGGGPTLEELTERVYGPAQYIFTMKGRSAEAILASVITAPGKAVLTHGLFKTTERAVQQAGGRIELAPTRPHEGHCDLDLAWLEERLAAGHVGSVYLEPNNNGLGGLPLHLENAEAVAQACRRHDVLLILDATRLLSNCAQLGGELLETVRRFTRLADAFTVSLGKEFLAPYGAVIAVRNRELRHQAFTKAFQAGALLEPVEGRRALAASMERLLRNPAAMLNARLRQLRQLADGLRARGISCLQPHGGHAVYVCLAELIDAERPLHARSLECLLYRESGIRAYIWPFSALPGFMRLALPLGRYTDEQLSTVPAAVATAIAHAADAPRLAPIEGESALGMFSPFRRLPTGTSGRR